MNLNMELAGLGGQAFVKGVFHSRFFIPVHQEPEVGRMGLRHSA